MFELFVPLLCFFCLCIFVHTRLRVCFCICTFVRARLCTHFCTCGRTLERGSRSPREPRRRHSDCSIARKSNKQLQTDQRRMITQKRNPVDFSIPSGVGPARWAAHNIFSLKYKTEYAVIPTCKKGLPDAPAARRQRKALQCEKSVHTPERFSQTNQLNTRNNISIARMRHGFRCSNKEKGECDRLVEEVSCEEESDRASLQHGTVEFRIAQDCAVLFFWGKCIKQVIEFPLFTQKCWICFSSPVLTFSYCGSVRSLLHCNSSTTQRPPTLFSDLPDIDQEQRRLRPRTNKQVGETQSDQPSFLPKKRLNDGGVVACQSQNQCSTVRLSDHSQRECRRRHSTFCKKRSATRELGLHDVSTLSTRVVLQFFASTHTSLHPGRVCMSHHPENFLHVAKEQHPAPRSSTVTLRVTLCSSGNAHLVWVFVDDHLFQILYCTVGHDAPAHQLVDGMPVLGFIKTITFVARPVDELLS